VGAWVAPSASGVGAGLGENVGAGVVTTKLNVGS
jgi:hypothetical protein